MKKLIIFEGLPGVGKTTLVKTVKSMNLKNVTVIDEIINKKIIEDGIYTEDEFIMNDIEKIEAVKDGIVIMDRGLISSLSYSQAKEIIDPSYSIEKAKDLFKRYKNILEYAKIYYLTNNLEDIKITGKDDKSPYGSYDNQKLLEEISIFNVKRYCKNYVIREYHKKDMEKIIYEVTN